MKYLFKKGNQERKGKTPYKLKRWDSNGKPYDRKGDAVFVKI